MNDKVSWVLHCEDVPHLWMLLEPLVHRSVASGTGEITTKRIHDMLLDGTATAFVISEGKRISFMLIAQIIPYAQHRAARVIACAGEDLRGADRSLSTLTSWAKLNQATEIEAWCPPHMSKLLKSLETKWVSKYEVLSVDLRSIL